MGKAAVNISQNQANDQIVVSIGDSQLQQVSISLNSQTGQQVLNKQVPNGTSEVTLDTRQVAAGNYNLKVTAGQQPYYNQDIVIAR